MQSISGIGNLYSDENLFKYFSMVCVRACVRACMCVLCAHAPALLCRGRVWWAELFEREPQASLCTSLPGPYFSPLGPRRPRVSM